MFKDPKMLASNVSRWSLQVVSFADFKELADGKSMAAIKAAGKYRQEGKQYVVAGAHHAFALLCSRRIFVCVPCVGTCAGMRKWELGMHLGYRFAAAHMLQHLPQPYVRH